MRELNPNYSYAQGLDVLRPRITIAMHFATDGSDIVYFTSHDDIGRPQGGGVQAVDGCVKSFTGATQKIDPINNTASIGSISFELVDVGGAVSAILAQKNSEGKSPREKKLQVYFGFGNYVVPNDQGLPSFIEVLDWLDYELQFTMLTKGYQVGPGVLRFTAEDVQRLEQPELFVPDKTNLMQTITAEQMLIPVAELLTSPKFQLVEHDSTYGDRPGQTVGYVRIEDEVICHTGFVNDGVLGVCLQVATDGRGALNTEPAGHEVDPNASGESRMKVEEFIYLEGPVLKLLYAVQTGVLYGQGGATLPDNWHQGIPADLVRLADYLTADPMLWNPADNTGRRLRFEGLKKQNGDKFISEQLLGVHGGVRPVYSDGAIGFKRLTGVLSGAGYVAELNDSNIVSLGELAHKLEDVVNEISINWNWDFRDETFLQTTGLLDAASIAKYRVGQARRYDFYGVKSFGSTTQDLLGLFNAQRSRFAGGGLEISAELLPKVQGLEVGDIVRLTTSKITDPLTALPLDRSFEVQQVTPSSRSGRPRLQLFASAEGAGEFQLVTASQVMHDDFYSSEGTDLATFPQVVAGVITADITLTGGDTMGQGIYYHLGNLEQAPGTTIYITHNVQLRVRGFWTRRNVRGIGAGLPGGIGATEFIEGGVSLGAEPGNETERHAFVYTDWARTNETAGTPGFFGPTAAARFARLGLFPHSNGTNWVTYVNRFPGPVVVGRAGLADPLPLVNRDGMSLPGINALDLRGTSGSGSPGLVTSRYYDAPIVLNMVQAGADGGAGGAALLVICRGEGVASGDIDLSGADGDAVPPHSLQLSQQGVFFDLCNGGGGGGSPGAYYLLLDGQQTSAAALANVTQNRGLAGLHPGSQVIIEDPAINNIRLLGTALAGLQVHLGLTLNPPTDMAELGFRVQYIPVAESIGTAPIRPPRYQLQPITGGLTLVSGTPELLGSADGTIRERIRVTWTESTEAQATEYEVQAKQDAQPDTAYRTVAVTTTGEAYIDVTEGIIYRVRVRVRGLSNVIASEWVVSSAHEAQGKSLPPSDPPSFFLNVGPTTGVVLGFGEHPDADFLDYIITRNGTEVWRGAATVYQDGFIAPGAYTYVITARDRSGNLSDGTLSQSVTITGPNAPAVTLSYRGENYFILATPSLGSFPVDTYRLMYGAEIVAQFDARYFQAKVDWAGSRTLTLYAIDRGGNVSASGTAVVIDPAPPAAPVLSAPWVDNVVNLFYSSTPGSLPVERYEVYTGATFETAVKWEDKAGSSKFTVLVFEQATETTIFVRAVDTAGNYSPVSSIGVKVQDPPDFTFFASYQQRPDGWPGTNFAVLSEYQSHDSSDLVGGLILGANPARFWDDYDDDWATFQAQHDAGYTLWFQPWDQYTLALEPYHRAERDFGTVLASAIITVGVASRALSGSPAYEVDISWCDTQYGTYTTATNTRRVAASNVRFVRVTVRMTTIAAATQLLLEDITISLTLKKSREDGRAAANAADSGGTTVTLVRDWAALTSIKVQPIGSSFAASLVDGGDGLNPTDFQVYLFDSAGARISGDFYWEVEGYLSN